VICGSILAAVVIFFYVTSHLVPGYQLNQLVLSYLLISSQ